MTSPILCRGVAKDPHPDRPCTKLGRYIDEQRSPWWFSLTVSGCAEGRWEPFRRSRLRARDLVRHAASAMNQSVRMRHFGGRNI